ncbi:hypothetical protein NN561_016031 [Cricetulus griseus]
MPLTCQPSLSGVFPDSIQRPGGGVPDVVAEGPPQRGSQGPSHHVVVGVPHPPASDFGRNPPDPRSSQSLRTQALRPALRPREAAAGGLLAHSPARAEATSGKA